jgi:hypothetical protein
MVPGSNIETFFAQTPEDAAELVKLGGIQTWLAAAEKVVDMYHAALRGPRRQLPRSQSIANTT